MSCQTSPSATNAPPDRSRAGTHPGLWALAAGGFGIGLTEFVIAGLLSDVATSLAVDVPTAGILIWGYALAVVVGALTVTVLLFGQPPKRALVVLLVLFILGNLLTAAAPSFGVALAGRVVTALCHGGFFGIGAVLAQQLVPEQRRASAVAVMFGGLTAANVLGVPFGTFVGQHAGWRATFAIIAVVGVVALVGIAVLVPAVAAEKPTGSPYRVLLRGQVQISVLLTLTLFGGLFGAFIYVEPLARHVTGFSAAAVPWLLVVFGLGLTLGNVVGGRLADRDLGRTLRWLALLLPIALVGYGLLAAHPVPMVVMLFVIGFLGFALTPPLQVRVTAFATDAPAMASAANIAAFNLGNAIGSALGGLGIAAGLGWVSPVWIGAAMAALGAVLAWTTRHEVGARA